MDALQTLAPPGDGVGVEKDLVPAGDSLDALPLDVEVRGPALRRALSLVTIAWLFGSVWGTAVAGAPFTLFAQQLGASKFQYGLLSALPFIASFISMPASLLTERTGQRKRIFFWGLYINRLLWIPLGLVPLWMVWTYGPASTAPAMGVFILLYFFIQCGQAFGGPAWTSWMADICPERKRGKYFARRRQWGIITALPTALLVGWLLDRVQLSAGYDSHHAGLVLMSTVAVIFCLATIPGLVDIASFHWVPEVPRQPQRGPGLFRAFFEPLRNKEFLWFGGFVATLTFAVCFMGQFATLYLIEKLQIKNMQVQLMLLVVPMAAQLLVFPVFGAAVDRMGKKPLLAMAALGLTPVGLGWCFLSGSNVWLGYVLTTLGAVLWVGIEVANLNVVLQFSGSADEENGNAQGGTAYVAVNSVIINVAGCLGGLASGLIAQWLQDLHWQPFSGWRAITFYDVLFVLSGLLRFLSVAIFLPHIHEPAAKPTRDTVRFMVSNIYNNLFNAILQPLRLMRQLRQASYEERD